MQGKFSARGVRMNQEVTPESETHACNKDHIKEGRVFIEWRLPGHIYTHKVVTPMCLPAASARLMQKVSFLQTTPLKFSVPCTQLYTCLGKVWNSPPEPKAAATAFPSNVYGY